MMKKRILRTIVYMLVVFIVYGVMGLVSGSENPFLTAGQLAIPLGVGYYFGWGDGRDEIRKSYNLNN